MDVHKLLERIIDSSYDIRRLDVVVKTTVLGEGTQETKGTLDYDSSEQIVTEIAKLVYEYLESEECDRLAERHKARRSALAERHPFLKNGR